MPQTERSDILVYLHRNSKTGRVFYVGIGVGNRPYHHRQRSRFWKFYVEKNGEPIVQVIHRNLTIEKAVELEKRYIALFGRRDKAASGCLVNMTDGGEGAFGRTFSETSIQALKNKHTGKVMSAESRRKMSLSKTGRGYPKPSIRIAVSLFDRQGNHIKDYDRCEDVTADGFNPLTASRMTRMKIICTRKDRSFFVRKEDASCPAYVAIRVAMANKPRDYFSNRNK